MIKAGNTLTPITMRFDRWYVVYVTSSHLLIGNSTLPLYGEERSAVKRIFNRRLSV